MSKPVQYTLQFIILCFIPCIYHIFGLFCNYCSDERLSFEVWFQDLQLSVNECFESPESRSVVETSVQRLSVRRQTKCLALINTTRWPPHHFSFFALGFPQIQRCRETFGPTEGAAGERQPADSSTGPQWVQRVAEGTAGGGGHIHVSLCQQAEANGIYTQWPGQVILCYIYVSRYFTTCE